MSRPAVQSNKWEFEVVQRQLPNPLDPNVKVPFFGNFRTDTKECLGTTTEQYGIVQNGDLLKAAEDALDKRGLSGFSKKIIVTGSGERMYAEYTFQNKQLVSGVGDIFGYKLTVQNSFDRSLRASLSLGFLRLVCSNGMATLEKEFGMTKKHSTKVTTDFVLDAIDKALNHGQNALKVYDQMASVAISDEQGQNILRQLEDKGALSGVIRQCCETFWLAPRRQEDKGRNLYNLYNAITEHLKQVTQERYEYANKVNNDVLLRLVNAARNPANLAKIIVPVAVPVVEVAQSTVVTTTEANGAIVDAEIVSETAIATA